MTRFFFNVHDGRDIRDTEGSELASRGEVREVALSTAGQLLKTSGNADLWAGKIWQMVVSDGSGVEVLALSFAATEFPYTFPANRR